MVPPAISTMLMVDEESPIFKEVANAPAPITQRIAEDVYKRQFVNKARVSSFPPGIT